MIQRTLEPQVLALAERHPVLTLTGPRQSGKTTLCRTAFPQKAYVSLEPPSEREFAQTDPRGFLAQYPEGAVIDEVQRVPELLSYIQGIVDKRQEPGLFILTGSQHLGLLQAVSQTLAGRTVLLNLLPLGLDELCRFPKPTTKIFPIVWAGGYPRIHDHNLPPEEWLASYSATYVERDVRQLINIGDLLAFQTFLQLCAGRVGQLLNLSSLGADCGITHTTAKSWLSLLEASFIAFRLAPFHRNIGKRLIKTPKLYFYDSGLLCYLLGIRSPEQLERHPLRGAIFESWCVSEILKHHYHRAQRPNWFFYRDRKGHEVDLILNQGERLLAVEIKSGRTPAADYFSGLTRFAEEVVPKVSDIPGAVSNVVVYAGERSQKRSQGQLLSWEDTDTFPWLGSS